VFFEVDKLSYSSAMQERPYLEHLEILYKENFQASWGPDGSLRDTGPMQTTVPGPCGLRDERIDLLRFLAECFKGD